MARSRRPATTSSTRPVANSASARSLKTARYKGGRSIELQYQGAVCHVIFKKGKVVHGAHFRFFDGNQPSDNPILG